MDETKKLLIIAGPTASGKSAAAIELALELNGEIISADSMQVYKGMDIGTAKVTEQEKKGVKHYLINEFEPDEEFNITVFQSLANKYIQEIHDKGKLPIIAGGTGFYINSVIYGTQFTDTETDSEYRDELFKLASEKGNESVHALLSSIDPESASAIHANNLKRVIRALEFFKQSNQKISEHNLFERQKKMVYNTDMYILFVERSELYSRIDQRVDKMFDSGLVFEVKKLLEKYDENLISMQGLGYKETVAYLKGKTSLEESKELIKKSTRNFAKRQMTWFKNSSCGKFINAEDLQLCCENIKYNIGRG